MSVKIDKYQLIKSPYSKTSYVIINKLYQKEIVCFETGNAELNQIFGKMILDELNTGKYEDMVCDYNG